MKNRKSDGGHERRGRAREEEGEGGAEENRNGGRLGKGREKE